MDINKVLEEYDAMFGEREPREILSFLVRHIDMAKAQDDMPSLIILLNETVGFCRDASYRNEGVRYAQALEELMHELDFTGRIEYATTMLNLANAYRGFGMHEDSARRYAVCEEMYKKMLPEGDMSFASLYNNQGLLYEETLEWARAVDVFRRALSIVDTYPERRIEQATTRANLANALIGGADPGDRSEAARVLEEAIDLFEQEGGEDFHYSAALSALGSIYFYEQSYAEAADCFARAMRMLYAGTGASEAYERVRENYELALRYAGIQEAEEPAVPASSLEQSRRFYQDVLMPLIESRCPEALPHIAIGYAGEGSEHFGYDDTYSHDHDYAKGCCIWIQELYAPAYGAALQHIYEEACRQAYGSGQRDAAPTVSDVDAAAPALSRVREEAGIKADVKAGMDGGLAAQRQGVMLIDDYFARLTGLQGVTMRSELGGLYEQLYLLDDEQTAGIAAAVNGALFYDGEGTMTKLRRYFLEEMPEEYRRRRMATLAHSYAQAGQYNYARSMRRGDYVTAQLYRARAMETAMQLAHYLNRRYPPYLKWLRRSTGELPALAQIADICDALSDMPDGREKYAQGGVDDTALTYDIVAGLLLDEMARQGLVTDYDGKDSFLDRYIVQIAGLASGGVGGGDGRVQGQARAEVQPGGRAAAQGQDRAAVQPGERAAVQDRDRAEVQPGGRAVSQSRESAASKRGEYAASQDLGAGAAAGAGSADAAGREGMGMMEMTEEAAEDGMERVALIDAIVQEEWAQFDKTVNEGGRADCQDNWETFSVMRRSQYLTWPVELLASFYQDLRTAAAQGRNLITEKYGRMMASTAPERYAELAPYFPAHSEERIRIQEEIVRIQVGWMEAFAAHYPRMAGNARIIHTAEDTPEDTSYETYLRGEIGTYSEETLLLYGRFIATLAQAGRNLAHETMDNTARILGYAGVDDAEARLSD